MSTIRPAAVAGLFYPDNPIELKRTVADLLAQAGTGTARPAPKALIVPHAGYIYSGAVAASAFSALADLRGRRTRDEGDFGRLGLVPDRGRGRW